MDHNDQVQPEKAEQPAGDRRSWRSWLLFVAKGLAVAVLWGIYLEIISIWMGEPTRHEGMVVIFALEITGFVVAAASVYLLYTKSGGILWRICYSLCWFVFFAFYTGLALVVADHSWTFFPALCVILLLYFSIKSFCAAYLGRKIPRSVGIALVAIPCVLFVGLQILHILGSRMLAHTTRELIAEHCPINSSELQEYYDRAVAKNAGNARCNAGPLLFAAARMLAEYCDSLEQPQSLPYLGTDEIRFDKIYDEGELREIGDFLTACDPFSRLVTTSFSFPGSYIPLKFPHGIEIWSMELPHYQSLSKYTSYLKLKAFYHQGRGENEAALAAIREILQIADTIKDEPLLISQLIRTAIGRGGIEAGAYYIYHAQDVGTINELAGAIAPFCHMFDINKGIMGEIVGVRVLTEESLLSVAFSKELSIYYGFLYYPLISRGWVKYDLAYLLQEHLRIYRLWDEGEKTVAAEIFAHPPSVSWLHPGAALFLPTWKGIATRELHRLTITRCLWAAAQIKIWQLQNGQLPDSLQVIAPEQTWFVTDPVTGDPLRYQIGPTYYLVYGVGQNGVDDGGQFDNEDMAHSPKADVTQDWGIKMRK